MNRPQHPLLGQSRAILEVLDEARLVSATDCKVLLTGESGVGKEPLAQFIHANSRRRHCKMLSANCAGVPERRLETELFGPIRGSLTGARNDRAGLFARAHGSTLMLNDVGEIGPRMQALLLRALENGDIPRDGSTRASETVDVRIISASSRDLLQPAAEQAFSVDLYYRLNAVHLQIPPLRERREDISHLMRYSLKMLSDQLRLPVCELHPFAMAKLQVYSWPGNTRELRDVAELLAVMHAGQVVTDDQLPEMVLEQRGLTQPIRAAVLPQSSTLSGLRAANKSRRAWNSRRSWTNRSSRAN